MSSRVTGWSRAYRVTYVTEITTQVLLTLGPKLLTTCKMAVTDPSIGCRLREDFGEIEDSFKSLRDALKNPLISNGW
jgi:hypothetical protein